ncbi:hypothetical protein GCM10023197_19620 [Gordonia humi]|uniref:Uncharacterized protein n=1 Tax=Gordonia humi TaxID=686429 RepID=A0A840EXH0_9ACTN|nr:hypothetical protein [Gordonia humi]
MLVNEVSATERSGETGDGATALAGRSISLGLDERKPRATDVDGAPREHGRSAAEAARSAEADVDVERDPLVIYPKTRRENASSPTVAVPDTPETAFDLGFQFPDGRDVADAGLAASSMLGGTPALERAAQRGSGRPGVDPGSVAAAFAVSDQAPRSLGGRFKGVVVAESARRTTEVESLSFSLRISTGAVSLAAVSPVRAAAAAERAAQVSIADSRSSDQVASVLRAWIEGGPSGVIGGVRRSEFPALGGRSVSLWWDVLTAETQRGLMRAAASAAGAVHLSERGESTREITEWSRKSRASMVKALAELDYSPIIGASGIPCMVTLTYPGCWLRVAPDGPTVKKHLDAFRHRFERRYGAISAVWKLEFQGRRSARCGCEGCDPVPYRGRDDGRAPHFHVWLAMPTERNGWACVERPIASASSTRLARSASGLFRVSWRQATSTTDRDQGTVARQRSFTTEAAADEFFATHRAPVWVDEVVAETPGGFSEWLAAAWSEVVGHPDREHRRRHREVLRRSVSVVEGLRASDPKRLAVYFAKHGAAQGDSESSGKEYQHFVPEAWRGRGDGPGRFWGYWGLSRVASSVTLSTVDFIRAKRVMRRWSRSRAVYPPGAVYPAAVHPNVVVRRRERGRPRADGSRRTRRCRSRRTLLGGGGMVGGFACVNSGPDFGVSVARAVALW